MAEDKKKSKNSAVLEGNVNIHCFVCGIKVSVEGKVPGGSLNCPSCQTKLTVPDEDVLKKLASFGSFTETPMASSKLEKDKQSNKPETIEKVKVAEKEATVASLSSAHKIFCKGCTAKIDVSDQPVDSRFSCPACGMVLRVPEKPSEKPKEEVKDSKSEVSVPTKLKINCHTCGAKIDVTHEVPFKKVNCPACNAIFTIPKRFSHFLLEERLGENSHFSVYRALDLTLSREVCLKVMTRDYSEKKTRVDKFLASAGKIVLVSDPNIVPIYSSGEHEGLSFVVMQYMSASSMDRYLEKAKGLLPLKSVYRCIKEAAKGFRSARKQGISHNNISLKNILVDGDGNIKISDFEYNYLLFQLEEKKELTSFFDPLYLSPEMMAKNENSLAGDIYSFGSVFYHLITGVPPFPGNTPKEILQQRVDRTPIDAYKMRREIPEDISGYIMKMMSADPDMRPASFEAILQELDKLMTTSSGVPKPLTSGSSSQADIVSPLSAPVNPEVLIPEVNNKKNNSVIVPIALVLIVILAAFFLMKGGIIDETKEPKVITKVDVDPMDPVNTNSDPVDPVNVNPDPVSQIDPRSADAPVVQRGFPVDLDARISPAGISFRPYGTKILEYLELHKGDSHTQEISRVKILRSIKSYLETLLKHLPYDGKIYVKGQNVIDGQIIDASVKTVTLLIADEELTISWNRFEFRQYLDILEFYIGQKKQQLDTSSPKAVEDIKKDIADDYFRAALLGDWYKQAERNSNYVKQCLQYNPAMRSQVEAYLPSISE